MVIVMTELNIDFGSAAVVEKPKKNIIVRGWSN